MGKAHRRESQVVSALPAVDVSGQAWEAYRQRWVSCGNAFIRVALVASIATVLMMAASLSITVGLLLGVSIETTVAGRAVVLGTTPARTVRAPHPGTIMELRTYVGAQIRQGDTCLPDVPGVQRRTPWLTPNRSTEAPADATADFTTSGRRRRRLRPGSAGFTVSIDPMGVRPLQRPVGQRLRFQPRMSVGSRCNLEPRIAGGPTASLAAR